MFIKTMEKKDIVQLLNETLVPNNFKRKGNYWVDNHGEITKMVNLQKSDFATLFYINYGYILKTLPLGGTRMHIENRLASSDWKRLAQLLNLENDLPDSERSAALKEIFSNDLLPQMLSINSEGDIRNYLKIRPILNDIPLNVKAYFQIS